MTPKSSKPAITGFGLDSAKQSGGLASEHGADNHVNFPGIRPRRLNLKTTALNGG